MQKRIFDPLGMESAVLIEGVPQEGKSLHTGIIGQRMAKGLILPNGMLLRAGQPERRR